MKTNKITDLNTKIDDVEKYSGKGLEIVMSSDNEKDIKIAIKDDKIIDNSMTNEKNKEIVNQ